MTMTVFDCFSAADFYLWMIEDKFLEMVSPFSPLFIGRLVIAQFIGLTFFFKLPLMFICTSFKGTKTAFSVSFVF